MPLSSGYLANSTNHAQVELDDPILLSIDNGASGQLIVHLSAVDNAHSYQVKVMTADGKVVTTVDSIQSRNVVLPGLTPGMTCTMEARAVGGLRDIPIGAILFYTWRCESCKTNNAGMGNNLCGHYICR